MKSKIIGIGIALLAIGFVSVAGIGAAMDRKDMGYSIVN